MKLKYVPNPYGYLKPARENTLEGFLSEIFEEFPEFLQKLFTNKEVIEAIKENNFEKVFDIAHTIEHGEKRDLRGCNPLALCHFFYLLDIDFMPYLSYDYIKRNILHGEWKEKDKEKDGWDDVTYFEKVDD